MDRLDVNVISEIISYLPLYPTKELLCTCKTFNHMLQDPNISALIDQRTEDFDRMIQHPFFLLKVVSDKILLSETKSFKSPNIRNSSSIDLFFGSVFQDMCKTCGFDLTISANIMNFGISDEYAFELFQNVPVYKVGRGIRKYIPAENPEYSIDKIKKEVQAWCELCWFGIVQ